MVDNTGDVELHIWSPLFSSLVEGEIYNISHLIHKVFRDVAYMSTTRSSEITVSKAEISLPKDVSSFVFTKELNLSSFDDVVKVAFHYHCSCNKRFDFVDTTKPIVKCQGCSRFKRFEDLDRNIVVQVSVKVDKEEQILTIAPDVLKSLIDLTSTDEESIAIQLLSLKDLKVQVDRRQKMITAIL